MATRTNKGENESSPYPVTIALVVLAVVVGYVWLPKLFRGTHSRGGAAPEFHVELIANAESLAVPPAATPKSIGLSELKGKPILLDFWATWCPPCREELPIINQVANRYSDKGLVVVGINTSDEDGLAAPFIKRRGYTYPIAFDTNNAAARAYGADALPTLVVIARDGTIVGFRQGTVSESDLETMIDKAL